MIPGNELLSLPAQPIPCEASLARRKGRAPIRRIRQRSPWAKPHGMLYWHLSSSSWEEECNYEMQSNILLKGR